MDRPTSTCIIQVVSLVSLAVLSLSVSLATAAPPSSSSPSDADFDDVFYDQRQNGSENFRIHLNDVMVVVAPAEALLGADLLGGGGGLGGGSGGLGAADLPVEDAVSPHKECKPGVKGAAKCSSRPASQHNNVNNKRSRLRLSNFLLPFINRAHH
ncbi:uncharacterized protein LOC111053968 [Nilaparvata lugens]|uniref:uncharacterized protein LOC111053968 n=1 Tax=Nilaparvata lugens TaxID=108931 RepID=UPI00193C9B4E|nr:uncharacterized protein LOC111053968 [Nilaparvata lugens]